MLADDENLPDVPPVKKHWAVRLREKLEPWQKLISVTGTLIGFVAGLFGGGFAVATYIKTNAQNAVLDEKFLGKISAQIRPSCIVTSKGSVESDKGAMEHLNDFDVIFHQQAYAIELIIKPKHHLANPPMVTSLNSDLSSSLITRGKLHEWSVSMRSQSTLPIIITEQTMDTNKVYRFLVEILR